jgi:AraC family transcriptional regulator of adaptative response/methylated-DNA-[protein]-cysteine methyltransferase
MKIIAKTASKAQRGRNLTLVWGVHDFPAGKILVALSHEGLCWLGIDCDEKALKKNWPGANFIRDEKVTAAAAKDVVRKWPKGLEKLSTPVVLYGTAFQLKVWRELLKIKSGKTVTYQDVAKKIGKPKAVRAVGSAVGKNTVAIVVPCHRVINKTGGRINYGWGPKIKIALLKGEGAEV